MIKTSELMFNYKSDDTYFFSPDEKFRSFSTYLVKITPKTRKIYSIAAAGSMDDDSTCEKEQALIMAIIKKKYGEIEKDEFGLYELYDVRAINQGNKSVTTKCIGLFDAKLTILYRDSKLAELAENERIELESSKVDSSSL